MAQRIRLGLIGVQRWGRAVGEQMAASELVELAYVHDLDAAAAEAAGRRWNARVARSVEELLASDIAGVVIITPNHTHLPLGLAAAAAGKHAMIVKPITNTIAEGRQLIDAFARAGVFLAANHPARKYPISRYVKQLLDAGQFGTLVMVANVTGHNGGMRKQPTDWRAQRSKAPGGPLIQLTVHTFDTWQYWFGPIVEVQANIDDATPEELGCLAERLLRLGALDVFFAPIQMKKFRPATLLTVLTEPSLFAKTADELFRAGSTFGVRYDVKSRAKLARETLNVKTPWGEVRVNVGRWDGEAVALHPEYDDCRALAEAENLPLRQVVETARRLAGSFLNDGSMRRAWNGR